MFQNINGYNNKEKKKLNNLMKICRLIKGIRLLHINTISFLIKQKFLNVLFELFMDLYRCKCNRYLATYLQNVYG